MANRTLAGLLFVHAISRVAGFRMAIGSLWTKASSAVQPDWIGCGVSPDGQRRIARDIVCSADSSRNCRRKRRHGLCLHCGYNASRRSFEKDWLDRGCVWDRFRSGSRYWRDSQPFLCDRSVLVRGESLDCECDSDVDRSSRAGKTCGAAKGAFESEGYL